MEWTRGHTLGHGSTATVSLARSLLSGDVLAVKSAELDQSQFLQREQKILSSLASPHIVGYKGYDVTRENNKAMYNLFLEYISGGTLTDAVQAHGGRLEESVIRYYTNEIVQGLDYLHSNGWVHCDIKGRNVLIGENGAKIADFGCAKKADAVEAVAEAAAPIAGTPMFMAPEVARGEEQGFASDVWALGCTIIEMANGGTPWPNVNDPVSVMYRIGFSDHLPEFPCSLSEQARDFLDKCLRRDPKQRWTADQLLKHPFLVKSNSNAKQIQESNSTSNSPTSILDQGFWNSLDESESENVGNLVQRSNESSGKERIRRLSMLSGGPSWDWEENWISVRGNSREKGYTIMDSTEAKDDVIIYRSLYQESFVASEQSPDDLLDSNVNDRISGEFFLGSCKYGTRSFSSKLESNRNRDTLLIPYIPSLLLRP